MALTVDHRPQQCQEAEPWTAMSEPESLWQRHVVPTAKSSLSQLVDATLRRLERDAVESGKRFSVRALEAEHHIAQGTLSKLRKGVRSKVDNETLPAVASALGLPIDVLTRKGEPAVSSSRRTQPAQAPTPVPATVATAVSDDDTDAMIAEAARGLGFEYDDAVAVRPLVRERAALARSREDNLGIIRAWLTVSRDLRERGESTTKQAIIAELSRRAAKSTEGSREAAETATRAVDDGLRAKGHEVPSEPSAAVQKVREGRKIRGTREEG